MEKHTSTNDGTDNTMSVSVALAPAKKLIGVGIIGIRLGSNEVITNPDDMIKMKGAMTTSHLSPPFPRYLVFGRGRNESTRVSNERPGSSSYVYRSNETCKGAMFPTFRRIR